MGAYAYQKADGAVYIRLYSDVVIRFWMKYETEADYDFVRVIIKGNDDLWYYGDATQWSGSSFTWRQYEVNLDDFGDVTPASFLRIGYRFLSDVNNGGEGAYIDDIEIWGIN